MISKKVIYIIGLAILISVAYTLFHYSSDIKIKLSNPYNDCCDEKNVKKDKIWGIDLSHHQKTIDWEVLVKKNRPDFIYLKATEGSTHHDAKYKRYLKKSREFDIPVGAYHFFSYQSRGKLQAQSFIKFANIRKGDLYPVLDVEFCKNMKNSDWIITEIKQFCKEIEKELGVKPIIYCEFDYFKKYLIKDFKEYNYWISDLYREPRCEYVFWQYTDKGQVNGIGKIDKNKFHDSKDLNDYIMN